MSLSKDYLVYNFFKQHNLETSTGSGMLLRPKVLESCIRNLSDILTIPMTVKMRMGAYKDENVAHELVSKFDLI